MLAALERVNAAAKVAFQMRIDVGTGPVVAGADWLASVSVRHLGRHSKWLASRLESPPPAGPVHVSPQTSQLLEGPLQYSRRAAWIDLRGIGKVRTAFITGRKGGVPPEFLEHEQLVGRSAPSRATVIRGWLSSALMDTRCTPGALILGVCRAVILACLCREDDNEGTISTRRRAARVRRAPAQPRGRRSAAPGRAGDRLPSDRPELQEVGTRGSRLAGFVRTAAFRVKPCRPAQLGGRSAIRSEARRSTIKS